MKTPISIITGYLGSGKTTLLQRIIDQADSKIAILMNEFGEIAIDSKIIKGENINMVELAGGCVCCSLVGEFESAVNEIIGKISPDLIVVETTGVAEPDALAFDIEENIPQVRLDSIITVVDSDAMVRFPNIGHTGMAQIEMADIIILNKSDLVSDEQLGAVKETVTGMNPKALILRAVRGNVNTRLLFGITADREIQKPEHREHLEEEKMEYFAYESGAVLDRKKFENLAAAMPESIYRAKGFVNFADGTWLFNFVAGRRSLEKFIRNEKTNLVFIGSRAKEKEAGILNALKHCE
ncbi:MAG: GTP-binding protein [Candidatus Kerfeldbacteria bacterium]|nr:GTP-binding protein [Candidatus Kerfeldbacteria bacterium]